MSAPSEPTEGIQRLRPCVMQYAWGRPGKDSRVASFSQASNGGQPLSEAQREEPFAELWMGTHPNAPARVLPPPSASAESHSSDALPTLSAFLGGKDLPFLFKVLSVNKALSIQSHPDKALAERLHAAQPDIYRDANHKPEMAIALTPFTAMVGFRPAREIAAALQSEPSLAALLGSDTVVAFAAAAASAATPPAEQLRELFSSLMRLAPDTFHPVYDDLVARDASSASHEVAFLQRLAAQHPKDVGVFAPFFLNVVHMKPGEAVFLGANEPHAYVGGDCLEAMACSDNVVRAGLTPKLRDVDCLLSSLTYSMRKYEPFVGSKVSEATALYLPKDDAVTEFAVSMTRLASGSAEQLAARGGPAIALVLEGAVRFTCGGRTTDANAGEVLLIPAGANVAVERAGAAEAALTCCFERP